MSNKTPVTCATRIGSAAGVAEAIGQTLVEGGAQVEVRPMKAVDISKVPSFGDWLKFRLSVVMGIWWEGDHRDWSAIRAWASNLAAKLQPAVS